jgi:hypothetical protein
MTIIRRNLTNLHYTTNVIAPLFYPYCSVTFYLEVWNNKLLPTLKNKKRSPKWSTVAAIAGVSLFALASLTSQNVKTENANTTPSQLMGASTQETQAGEEQLVDTPEANISTEASPTQTYYPANTLVPTLAPNNHRRKQCLYRKRILTRTTTARMCGSDSLLQ